MSKKFWITKVPIDRTIFVSKKLPKLKDGGLTAMSITGYYFERYLVQFLGFKLKLGEQKQFEIKEVNNGK